MSASDQLDNTFWDYIDTCRLTSGSCSHTPFVERTRQIWRTASDVRPEIETWWELRHYVTEVLNEPDLADPAYYAWRNYLIYTAPYRTTLSNRQLHRLRRQLREEQEARLLAEEAQIRAEKALARMRDRIAALLEPEASTAPVERDLAGKVTR